MSFAPLANEWSSRPIVVCDGNVPYSPLSIARTRVIRQWSTHRRKTPKSSKPRTVIPLISEPCTRWDASARQSPVRAVPTSMPASWPLRARRTTGCPLLGTPISLIPFFWIATAQVCADTAGQGLPSSR